MIVDYDSDRDQFFIRTPVATPSISDWLGWSRRQGLGHVYSARAWPTAVLGIKPGPNHELVWTEAAQQVRDALLNDLQLAKGFLSNGRVLPLSLPTERKPKVHQSQAVHAIARMLGRVLLADEMGLGKTATALWAAHEFKAKVIVVISPVSAKFNWQRELIQTIGEQWATFVIDGTPSQRASLVASALNVKDAGEPVALFINYDLLRHLPDLQLGIITGMASTGILVFDECHYLKDPKSDRSKLAAFIAARCNRILALSGTPIRNLADDLFSQVEIIRPRTWTSYRDFANRYLVVQRVKFGKREVNKVVGVKNLDELNAVINTLQIKRRKVDVLDLPPKTYTYPELELDGDEARIYKAMKEFAKIEIGAMMNVAPLGKISVFDPRAKTAVEAAMRCEQIAQGFIGGIPDPVMAKLDSALLRSAEKIEGRPNELVFPRSPKILWLLEMIETLLSQSGSVAVASRFNAPMFWLEKTLRTLNISSAVLHGSLSATQKDSLVLDFQKRVFDVLIFQVKLGEVWNATRCRDLLFLGRDWSPAINWQAEDRFYRMGQTGTVNVQVPIVKKTIEVMIHRRLAAKSADAEMALRNVTLEELMEAL